MSESTVANAAKASSSQTITTMLTPNSNSVAQSTSDADNLTMISFQYQARTTYWAPAVSSAMSTSKLAQDVGNSIVTFKAGLTVTYLPLSADIYNIVLTGQIIDNNTAYNFTGTVIGSFTQ